MKVISLILQTAPNLFHPVDKPVVTPGRLQDQIPGTLRLLLCHLFLLYSLAQHISREAEAGWRELSRNPFLRTARNND